MKFRKKPVEVEAVKASEVISAVQSHQIGRLSDWVVQNIRSGKLSCATGHVNISTSEGIMRGEPDDMIIRGVKGEIYPCKPDIFEATYDAVS